MLVHPEPGGWIFPDNRLELVTSGKAQIDIGKVALDFYEPGTYP